MTESTASTSTEQVESPTRDRDWRPASWRLRDVPAVDAIANELGSTDRYWAAKPPPGMESDPLDWDEITNL